MSSVEQSELRNSLQSRRTEIADKWYTMVSQVSPLPIESGKVRVHLALLTDQFLELLVAETFECDVARDIGANLYALGDTQPEDIAKIQQGLAEQVTDTLSAVQIAALQPRLIAVLSEMAIGFLAEKSRQTTRFNTAAISKMGHDLKTPINSITGFSRVMLKGIDGPITEFQQQDLTSIYNAGKLLLDMINELTQVRKNDEEKQTVHLETFDAAALFGDVVTTVQPLLAEQGHVLSLRMAGDLGVMYGPLSQVRWIVISMLLHAVRDMEPGTLWLSASREMVRGKDWLFVQVARNAASLSVELAGLEPQTEEAMRESAKDLAMITGQRFCQDLGGDIMVAQEDAGGVALIARIPAKIVIEDSV
ncbi:MAG: HAMP domain-containing histidine kinase [Anaerolineae bacterium]|nr:HAMP domain-containing histidine kinase [Anaerolineae bacterium]